MAAGIPKFTGECGLRASELKAVPYSASLTNKAEAMTVMGIQTGSATRGEGRSPSSAMPVDGFIEPNVTGFYEATTGSVQYVVADTLRRKCAVIDPVLDFDPGSGSTRTTSADKLLGFIEAHDLTLAHRIQRLLGCEAV